MARKRSRFSLLTWLLLTGVSGSGITGYLNPNLPIVGPFVKDLFKDSANSGGSNPNALRQSASTFAGQPNAGGMGGVTANLASAQIPRAQSAASNAPMGGRSMQRMSGQQKSSLVIASFNIQVLGVSKLSKPGMTETLASILRQFDLVAIQEVRAKTDDIIPQLISAINADGSLRP